MKGMIWQFIVVASGVKVRVRLGGRCVCDSRLRADVWGRGSKCPYMRCSSRRYFRSPVKRQAGPADNVIGRAPWIHIRWVVEQTNKWWTAPLIDSLLYLTIDFTLTCMLIHVGHLFFSSRTQSHHSGINLSSLIVRCITSSPFSLLAALALHVWSHSLVHLHHLLDQ